MASDKAKIRNLDISLRRSFSRIKEEMEELRVKMDFQLNGLKELKKDLEESKKDFIGVEKLNVLKVKIGDMMEEIKRVERLDKRLKELEKKAADKEQLKTSFEELKNKIDSVEKASNNAATSERLEKLIKEVNDEFASLRKSIKNIEEKGGSIVRDKLGRLEYDFNKKTAALGSRMNSLSDEMGKRPSKQEINQLLRDVNKEFDDLKESAGEIEAVKKDLKTVRREKLGKPYFEQQLEKLNSDIAGLKEELKEARREAKQSAKASKKAERKAEKEAGRKENAKGKSGSRRFTPYMFANMMIILAFMLLAAALVFFFTGNFTYMDHMIYAAVALFMIGIITRIIVVFRE
ncbi:MAG: hypothetical protein R6U32_07315 [Candidatus Woesearchaeota archaeon]